MPQSPIGVFNFLRNWVTGRATPANSDSLGNAIVAPAGAQSAALYVDSGQTIKSGPGFVSRANVIVAGAAGALYDCIGTADAATGNEIAVVPATAGPTVIDCPFQTGLTYIPGASQVATIIYQ